jgi:hypothetical protein
MEGHMAHLEGPQLRECRLVLPAHTKDGEPVDPAVAVWLEAELIKQFGGYTAYACWGDCTMRDGSHKHESGVVYDVALRGDPAYHKFVLIGLGVLRRADQETVYMRDPYGRVYIGSNAAELIGGWSG